MYAQKHCQSTFRMLIMLVYINYTFNIIMWRDQMRDNTQKSRDCVHIGTRTVLLVGYRRTENTVKR